MKKFFKTALAVTTAALLFTACGPAASTTTTEAAGGSEAASGEPLANPVVTRLTTARHVRLTKQRFSNPA